MSRARAFARFHAALLVLLADSPASAGTPGVSGPHLGVLMEYVEPDSARRADDHGLGASLLYGHPLGGPWSVETRLGAFVLHGEDGAHDAEQYDLGADLVYRFSRWRSWRPFVLAGLSLLRNDTDVSSLDDTDSGFHLGAGALSRPLKGTSVRLRAELRYVHDNWRDGYNDFRFGLGVQIPLGGRVTPASRPGTSLAATRPRDPDHDGIANSRDRCADSLEYVEHDADGCMRPGQLLRLYGVTFASGGTALTASAREQLAAVARALRAQPTLHARIDGHSDARGNASLNRRLSGERAAAVVTYLVLQGVPGHRLSMQANGETQPVASNTTANGRERNRRIEIVLHEPRRTAMETN